MASFVLLGALYMLLLLLDLIFAKLYVAVRAPKQRVIIRFELRGKALPFENLCSHENS